MQDDTDIIRRIYDAALHAESLPQVLQDLADRVGAHGSIIFDCAIRDGERKVGLLHHSTSYETDMLAHYVRNYNRQEIADQDRMADLSSTGTEINLIHDARLFSDTVPPGDNVDAMRRRGVAARYGALLNKDSWNTDRFAFQYVHDAALPNAEQLLWAETILSHLAKALSIGRVMARQRSVSTALAHYLDGLNVAVAVVDGRGYMQFSNAEMGRIAQDWEQVELSRDGRLGFRGAGSDAALNALMTQDTAHGNFGARPRREAVFLEGREPDTGLFIEICPISAHPELDSFGDGARLVSILDSAQACTIDSDIVSRFFPLTKSENLVLDLLAQGHSNAEIAEIRSRSVETINSQIKSVLRKTNARNRTEAVKIAVGLSAYGLPPEF